MTDDLPPIEREEDGGRGRWLIRLPDGTEAEMTFRPEAEGTIAVDHTFVPPAWRNRGVAERLMRAAIAEAGERGLRIVPVCPYVEVQFRRHPEWAAFRA